MTREEYLELCGAQWEKMATLSKTTDLYELEAGMHVLTKSLGQEFMNAQIGRAPADRRKKKSKK